MVSRSTSAAVLSPDGDRHFDDLVDKFADSLYGRTRGALRLAMLDHLLPRMLSLDSQPVLEVGAGLGQMATWFADRGHDVTVTEPAGAMLSRARQHSEGKATDYVQASLQCLPALTPGPWSLIVCHAVLEWLAEPRTALSTLNELLAPGGQVSLMVFNRDALRFSNVLKGNWDKVQQDDLAGKGRGRRLTPISPLTHAQITRWSAEEGLTVESVAGIRVFSDYCGVSSGSPDTYDRLLALEQQYCQCEPHWRLGRYLLYTLRKPREINDEGTA
ncbi:methyltransferase domain-containing protein [Aidingimonas halophila]|uniref:tRNA 5-carboxymethoxyuridine methyltransferase n=1 Tax=Aidingimonas halophila TaxID=574349 RepID=A0A1H2RKU6_9GAMM|nr:methyltransferase domain-containing protein [Aidingimonas halophila]GHC19042.1 tRNA 5-carboxymethoxyuridine methyltransferase [Aidingimonas halophila]SDW20092.1 S-adenosylmethionine-dependent methyltransferase [Aidingimonas halophila]